MQDKSPNAVSTYEVESGPGAPTWCGGRWRGHAGALAARHNRRLALARRPRLRAARPGCTHRTAPPPVWAPWTCPYGTPGPCAGGYRVRLAPAPPARCPCTTPDRVVLHSVWGTWHREVIGRMGKVGGKKTRASASVKMARSTECGPTVSSERVVRHQIDFRECALFVLSACCSVRLAAFSVCFTQKASSCVRAFNGVRHVSLPVFVLFWKTGYQALFLFSVVTEPDLISKHCWFVTQFELSQNGTVVTSWNMTDILLSYQFWPMWSKSRPGLVQLPIDRCIISGWMDGWDTVSHSWSPFLTSTGSAKIGKTAIFSMTVPQTPARRAWAHLTWMNGTSDLA